MKAFRLTTVLLERAVRAQRALAAAAESDPASRLELESMNGSSRTIVEIEALIVERKLLAGVLASCGLSSHDYILTTLTALEMLRVVQWNGARRPFLRVESLVGEQAQVDWAHSAPGRCASSR